MEKEDTLMVIEDADVIKREKIWLEKKGGPLLAGMYTFNKVTYSLSLPRGIVDRLKWMGVDLDVIKKNTNNRNKVAIVKILTDEDLNAHGVGFFFLPQKEEKR